MTREQKLGLIIGFTVVLVFGVLIADHLSRARTEPLISGDAPDEPLVIPSIAGLEPLSGGRLPPAPVREPSASDRAMADAGGVREPLGQVTDGLSTTARGRVVFGPPTEPIPGRDGMDLASIFEPAPVPTTASMREGSRGTVLPGFVPVSEPSTGVDIREAQGQPVFVAEPTTADRPVMHRVQRGESLFSIAARHYGNGHLWRELARHNSDKVDAQGGVAFDVVLTIPARRLLTGTPAAASGGSSGIVSSGVGYYTVREGDTLSEISQKLLGTIRRMDEIIKMNGDQINDADDIRVGMKLRYDRGPQA